MKPGVFARIVAALNPWDRAPLADTLAIDGHAPQKPNRMSQKKRRQRARQQGKKVAK